VLDRPSEPGKPSVLKALRNATHSLHASLASNPAMVRLFDKDYSISEYRAHLGRVLGFFEPLECVAARAAVAEDSVCPLQRSSDLREDLRIMGAVITMFDKRNRLSGLIKNEIHQYFPNHVFSAIIPRNVRLAEAPSYGRTISQYDKFSAGAKAYEELALEVIALDEKQNLNNK